MVRPDEIYNLAAQSHVQVSFDAPEFTADVDATGVRRVLEAVRACGLQKTCRITAVYHNQNNHFRSGDAHESIHNRVVSVHKPYVRPIVRG